MQDHYEVLGVSPTASVSVIKAAYRQLCKECHPDVTRSVGATRRMQALNAAHEVLTDPARRAAYDRQRREQAHGPGAANSSARGTPPPPRPAAGSPPPRDRPEPDPTPRNGDAFTADCACAKCGRLDASLRLTVFTWVVSVVVLSWRRDWARLLCGGCRLKYGLLFNLEVLLFGIWGFPWGIFWSAAALLRNATGWRGRELEERNATLLRELGRGFLAQGRDGEAVRALRESLRLRAEDADTAALLDQTRRRVPAAAEAKLAGFGLSPAYVHAGALGLMVLALTLVVRPQPPHTIGVSAQGHSSVVPAPDWAETMRRCQGAVVTLLVFDADEHQTATGSGFFVSAEGHIVTNHHVIENAAQVVVRLADGREFLAQGLLADSVAKDLALIALPRTTAEFDDLGISLSPIGPKGRSFPELWRSEQLPFLRLSGGRRVGPGIRLAVIGSPLGLAGTLSEGILSAERVMDGCKLIQISASLSPGSSGSPVLNPEGEVIGVATLASKAGYQNLNFAVSAEEVQWLVRNASSAVTNFAAWRPQGVPSREPEVVGRPESTPTNSSQTVRSVPARAVELNAEAIRLANEGKAFKALNAIREAARLAPANQTIQGNLALLEANGGTIPEPAAPANTAWRPWYGDNLHTPFRFLPPERQQDMIADAKENAARDGHDPKYITPAVVAAHYDKNYLSVYRRDVPAAPPAGTYHGESSSPSVFVPPTSPAAPYQPPTNPRGINTAPVDAFPSLNQFVLEQISTMPRLGGYSVSHAATANLAGAVRLDAIAGRLAVDPAGAHPSYCSGATYLVFLKTVAALRAAGRLPNVDGRALSALLVNGQRDGEGVWGRWNANGPGTARLFNELQLGRNFTRIEDARPGDFMKVFWTSAIGKSEHGHSVIYKGISVAADGTEQVHFWSSNQKGDQGSGYGEKTVPRAKVSHAIFSRLERPENLARAANLLPATDPYLASLLTRESSAAEAREKCGAP